MSLGWQLFRSQFWGTEISIEGSARITLDMVHVGDDGPGRPSYAATIGLLQGFNHPELVVIGTDERLGFGILTEFGDRVVAGERFQPWSAVPLDDFPFGINPVHQRHLADVMAVWHVYWEEHQDHTPCVALQVQPPGPLGAGCGGVRYWLDDPRPLVPRRRGRARHS